MEFSDVSHFHHQTSISFFGNLGLVWHFGREKKEK